MDRPVALAGPGSGPGSLWPWLAGVSLTLDGLAIANSGLGGRRFPWLGLPWLWLHLPWLVALGGPRIAG